MVVPEPSPSSYSSALLAALRLIRSENVGAVTFHHLVRRYGSAEAALDALPELARRGGGKRPITLASPASVQEELDRAEAFGAKFLLWGESGYPSLLQEISDAPPVLYVLGDPARLMQREWLGIVGARNASANGCRFAYTLARELGEAGYGIVSGLARGIDAQAHRGAVPTGTAAVIAGGIDTVYPPENAALYAELREQGVILSEQPFGMAPHSRSFPARNRIISGICRGVAVVEASRKSGSLITAQYALEQGREVFAVPGSPLDPRCRGTNGLIREGAPLIEGAEDVLAHLRQARRMPAISPQAALFGEALAEPYQATDSETAHARARVAELLSPAPVGVDDLVEQSGLSAALVITILLEKELAGMVHRHAGGKVSAAC
jgi:DNA processing protein